jgi:hypothetical protein
MRHNDAGGITLRDDIADDCAISLRHFQTVLAQEFDDRNRISHTAVLQDLLDHRRPDLEATFSIKIDFVDRTDCSENCDLHKHRHRAHSSVASGAFSSSDYGRIGREMSFAF